MAGRIRSIKPEILEDDVTAHLSHLEYRLFVGTWLIADDYGNLRGDPDYIRGRILWGTGETREGVMKALDALVSASLLVPYRVRGQPYLHIAGWTKHQRVDKPGKPRMPGPHEDAALAPHREADSHEVREDAATELQSRPNEAAPPGLATSPCACSSPESRMPANWEPDSSEANQVAAADATARGVSVGHATAKFRERARARSLVSSDWNASWRECLLTEFPTAQPIRESIARAEREQNARAAKERERAVAQSELFRPTPGEFWRAVEDTVKRAPDAAHVLC